MVTVPCDFGRLAVHPGEVVRSPPRKRMIMIPRSAIRLFGGINRTCGRSDDGHTDAVHAVVHGVAGPAAGDVETAVGRAALDLFVLRVGRYLVEPAFMPSVLQ